MTEMSPARHGRDPAGGRDRARRHRLPRQDRPHRPGVDMRIVDPTASSSPGTARRSARSRSADRGSPPATTASTRREVRRRVAAHRRRRRDRPARVHADRRPHQGRHQVRRRVDQLGRPRERAHGPPGRRRVRRHRRRRRALGRAAAGVRRGPRGREVTPTTSTTTSPTRWPSGGCRSATRSSRRSRRPRSASSTRRCCAAPTSAASSSRPVHRAARVVRLGTRPFQRVLLPVSADHLLPGGDRGLCLAAARGAARDEVPRTDHRAADGRPSEVELPRRSSGSATGSTTTRGAPTRRSAPSPAPRTCSSPPVAPTVTGCGPRPPTWRGRHRTRPCSSPSTSAVPARSGSTVPSTRPARPPRAPPRRGERDVRIVVTVRLPGAAETPGRARPRPAGRRPDRPPHGLVARR
jgi:hypothetical protein